MRTYELMLVVRPTVELTEEKARELAQKILGEEATIAAVTLLGKKQLAYPLKKLTEASYVQVVVQAVALRSPDVQRRTQSIEEILRFLLIQKEA